MKKYLASLMLLAACDPALPSASGTIFLGADVDVTEFQTLYVRAYPSPEFSLGILDLETAEALPLMVMCPLAGIEFPYDYHPAAAIGLEDQGKYQVFAWISRAGENPESKAPVSGDVYGHARFEAKKCGGLHKGYCGETTGVNITLDQHAP